MLPHAAASAPLARRRMAADLSASGVRPDVVDDAQLVLAELVGNAVRHGAGLPGDLVDIVWRLDDSVVEMRVTDGGLGMPRRRDAGRGAEAGRGLAIVDALTTAWGFEHPRDGGTSVWAWVAL